MVKYVFIKKDKAFQKILNRLLSLMRKNEELELSMLKTDMYTKLSNLERECINNFIMKDNIDIYVYDYYDIGVINGIINKLFHIFKKYEIPEGKFIVLEGTDGIGKSTLLESIKDLPFEVLLTREPGGTEIGEKIRKIILDNNNFNMSDITELFLYFASRSQHVEEFIVPCREAGINILSSRYMDSSYAYQLDGRSLPKIYLDTLADIIFDMEKLSVPSLVISGYVDNIDIVNDRIDKSNRELDRLELSGDVFLDKTNQYFKDMDVLSNPYMIRYNINYLNCNNNKETVINEFKEFIYNHIKK